MSRGELVTLAMVGIGGGVVLWWWWARANAVEGTRVVSVAGVRG